MTLRPFLRAELPSLLPIVDVAEALLHVKNGAWFLCLLVANVPDSFNEGELQLLQLLKRLLNHELDRFELLGAAT